MTVDKAFGDIAEILASMDPERILSLRASEEMAERVENLVNKKNLANLHTKNPLN